MHFEPTGHSLRHHSVDVHNNKDPDSLYEESVKNKIGGHESDHHGLPAYLAEDTPWEAKWRRENDEDWEPTEVMCFIFLSFKLYFNIIFFVARRCHVYYWLQ